MQVAEKLNDGLKREYQITVPAKDIAAHMDRKLQDMAEKVNMPGFRPGKAPMTMLKQRYGQSVLGEVIDFAVRDSSSKALQEKGVRPALQPQIELGDFGEGKDLTYTIKLEVLPEVKLKDISKLKLEKLDPQITDDDIDEALRNLAERFRGKKPVQGRAAQNGDTVTIDFEGKVDGVAFDGGTSKGYALELGSNSFLPDFESGVVGFKQGETRDIPVKFPDNYGHAELAGKNASFTITVHAIEEKDDAKIDDDLAKRLGFSDLKDLNEAAKTQIQREYQSVAREKSKRALFDLLDETYDFDMPQGLLDSEFDAIWRNFEAAKKNGRISEEDKAKSDDDMKAELRGVSTRRVKLGLILAEIGNEHKIDVSDDELRRAIMSEAQKYQGQEQRVLEFYQKTPQAVMELRGPMFEDKVVDYILETANVTLKPAGKKELFDADDSVPKGSKKSAKVKTESGEKPKAKKAK